jgi:adenylosuccinate synthase
MAAKKKAAKAGAGAVKAGKAARSNEYVQRLVEDDELRDNLRDAFDSVRSAYGRMANGKAPAKVLMDDKKTQRELKEAASSFREAADSLRGKKKKRGRRRRGGLVMLLLVGGAAAALLNEQVRNKLLDALFGAEEEFEYTSTTVPSSSGEQASETAGTA